MDVVRYLLYLYERLRGESDRKYSELDMKSLGIREQSVLKVQDSSSFSLIIGALYLLRYCFSENGFTYTCTMTNN